MKLLPPQCVEEFNLKHDSLWKRQKAQLLKASCYMKTIARLLTFDPFGPLAPDSPCFPCHRRIWWEKRERQRRWEQEKEIVSDIKMETLYFNCHTIWLRVMLAIKTVNDSIVTVSLVHAPVSLPTSTPPQLKTPLPPGLGRALWMTLISLNSVCSNFPLIKE